MLLIKNNFYNIYFYNNNFIFNFFFKKEKVNFKNNLKILSIKSKSLKINIEIKNQISLLAKCLVSYFLKKIKIAGKSYRIEKLNFGFNLTVGHTLNTYVLLKNSIASQTTKHKIFFYYLKSKKKQSDFNKIIYLRLWDVYTQRGLRFGKHKLFKKQGKKSSYV